MTYKKRFLAVALLVLAAALNATAAVINGVLVDAEDTTPLMQATVKLLKADKDSSYVKGLTTDANGLFNLRGVAPGSIPVPAGEMLISSVFICFPPNRFLIKEIITL